MNNIEQQLSQIPQFRYIHQHLLTSAQPSAEQLAQIKAYGVDTVINLGLSNEEPVLPHQDQHCANLGLNYLHIPIHWDCPADEQCLLVLDLVHALVQNKIVWVHCPDNRRVSSLMYLYQQFAMAIELPDAQEFLHHIWEPNATWTGLIHAMTLQLQGRKATQELEQSLQQIEPDHTGQ
ncbi:protein tyrosine phosphatase family protein [Acinetobacter rudis]|uniref:Tyrosine specific protein phosphatases domain-containing protein n=1 Tax=Acinetobacter rudis CIP 110305 TaxID=421052 RepID=S3NGA3_9GAMM|nr:protein tyrosine phosphatase family protein [Acinetobacter rudis]EPF73364.1 hypothetical protein F945_02120 [Acinetobacter rudis CIP 110305]